MSRFRHTAISKKQNVKKSVCKVYQSLLSTSKVKLEQWKSQINYNIG